MGRNLVNKIKDINYIYMIYLLILYKLPVINIEISYNKLYGRAGFKKGFRSGIMLMDRLNIAARQAGLEAIGPLIVTKENARKAIFDGKKPLTGFLGEAFKFGDAVFHAAIVWRFAIAAQLAVHGTKVNHAVLQAPLLQQQPGEWCQSLWRAWPHPAVARLGCRVCSGQ